MPIINSEWKTPYSEVQTYYCSVCDSNQVESNKPETGQFYQVFGHAFDDGDYHSVFFAVCKDCSIDKALIKV